MRTPLKLSAPDYINCLFDWVEEQVRWGGVGWLGRVGGGWGVVVCVWGGCACGWVWGGAVLRGGAAARAPQLDAHALALVPPFQLDDPAIFPQRYGSTFPPTFNLVSWWGCGRGGPRADCARGWLRRPSAARLPHPPDPLTHTHTRNPLRRCATF